MTVQPTDNDSARLKTGLSCKGRFLADHPGIQQCSKPMQKFSKLHLQETGAAESLRDTGLEGPGSPLGKFLRQMALLREACITPSGMDEELRWA